MAAAKWNTIKFEASDDDDDELIGYTTYVSFFRIEINRIEFETMAHFLLSFVSPIAYAMLLKIN